MSTFNINLQKLVIMAYSKIGVEVEFEPTQLAPNTDNDLMGKGLSFLDAMVKAWYAENVCLWKEVRKTIRLQVSSTLLAAASSGVGNADYVCVRGNVADNAGLDINGPPGVETNNWRSFWQELTTAASGNTWTNQNTYSSRSEVDVPVTGNVVSVDYVRIGASNKQEQTTELTKSTREGVMRLENTNAQGRPTHYWVEEYLPISYFSTNLEVPTPKFKVHLYPYPDSSNYFLDVVTKESGNDWDISTNPDLYIDFPVNWNEALIDNLAVRLAPAYGIFGDRLSQLSSIAFQSKKNARDASQYATDIQFTPVGYSF